MYDRDRFSSTWSGVTERVIDGVIDAIHAAGVEYIFGNPGSTEVPLLDRLVATSSPRYVLALHEGIAISMADGHASSSGGPAVVSVHATPGVANVLGGLFLASAHHSPVVVLAGQQDSRLLGTRPFLASDLVAMSSTQTKASWQAAQAEDVVPAVQRAFHLATEPPAGPVLLAVPRDFYDRPLPADPTDRQVVEDRPATPGPATADRDAIDRAADLVLDARRLIVLSGNRVGSRGAAAIDAVVRLAELTGARVFSEHNATNMHFPGDHPLYLGGNAHGMETFRPWLEGADTIVAIGCDLFMEDAWSERPAIPAESVVVQLDDLPGEIGRLIPIDAGLSGDIASMTGELTHRISEKMNEEHRRVFADRRHEVTAERAALDVKRATLREEKWNAEPIHMTRVYTELRSVMADDAIMVDEAVNMASYLHDFFPLTRPGTLLSSKQSWLGWGWGAALGVKLAQPDKDVVLCIGDGSACYALQALWTSHRHRVAVKALVLNNGRYMAVANHLRKYGGNAISVGEFPGTDISGVDFVKIAEGFGVEGRRVSAPGDLTPALSWMMSTTGPALVEVIIDPEDAGLGRPPIVPEVRTG